MVAKDKLLWVGDNPAPANVRLAAGDRWARTPVTPSALKGVQVDQSAIAVVGAARADGDMSRFAALLDELGNSGGVMILLLPADAAQAWQAAAQRSENFICIRADVSAPELAARLAVAADLGGMISSLRSALAIAREQASRAARTVEQVDEEMRLAAKLQRDFLPKRMPEVGSVRFGCLYRPASWVSGDIYDVIRLDETHVGCHVIDAVGHGMPAALLTMFIKKALQTKRIIGNTYEIVPPHVTMSELNADICEQNLSSCQFCTGFYGVVDTDTLTMTYCRAGHPPAILIHPDGSMDKLDGPGTLLGALPEAMFQPGQISLAEGDRVVLFTDGAEDVLAELTSGYRPKLIDVLKPWARMPREEVFLRMTALIDDTIGDGEPIDDITMVIMDIEPRPAP